MPARTANDGSNATFTTAGLPLTDPPDDAYLLATVYYETTSNPGAWKMQVDLATRVPLSAWSGAGASPVVLAPHFSPIASGSMQFAGSLPLALPGLPTVYMPTMVYLPPACTENAAACAAAKVVIVTDGDLALIPSLAPRWVAWADSLNLARESRPLALVFSASGLYYADGSAWACSRDAIYTPSTVTRQSPKMTRAHRCLGRPPTWSTSSPRPRCRWCARRTAWALPSAPARPALQASLSAG